MSKNNDDRRRKVKRFLAKKREIVGATEYAEGDGKVFIFNSEKMIPDFPGKFGVCQQYTVTDSEINVVRKINATAFSLINGIENCLAQVPEGTDVKLRIKNTGTGQYTVNREN